MKIYKIVAISLLATVGSTYAIKESSKQMILNCFTFEPFNELSVTSQQKLKKLSLSASADKYADLLLIMAGAIVNDSNKLVVYPDLALAMVAAVEKLSQMEKVQPIKLQKARIFKIKIEQEIERQNQKITLKDIKMPVPMRHEDAIRLQKQRPLKKLFW